MENINLQAEFIKELQKMIPSRSELVKTLSDILFIDKESISRRLNGKVKFTIDEIALLSKKLGVSVDMIVSRNTSQQWMPMDFLDPREAHSPDTLYKQVNNRINFIAKIGYGDSEMGCIFDSLPPEFYVYYPSLMKFMFFKWGHYFVGTEEYDHFSEWNPPYNIENMRKKCERTFLKIKKILYLWDDALIWILVREIKYFLIIHALEPEDKRLLKEEIHTLLAELEKYMKAWGNPDTPGAAVNFYLTNVHIGATGWYYISENGGSMSVQTNFIETYIDNNIDKTRLFREWVHSLRNVSTMTSGSGPKERRLFCENQHEIVDLVLR